MYKSLLILLILLFVNFGCAQRCRLTDLSKKYNFYTAVDKTNGTNEYIQVSKITLQIIDKANNKLIQQISFKADYLFENAFTDCTATRSFVTGKNKDADADDNDYGDFIVADFNFDGKEDFAVKQDSGGNGGPFYQYYTQIKPGKFAEDMFLTKQVGHFPGTIDARKKRLITYVHANVAGYNENIYKYNPITKKWIFFKQTYRKAGE